MGFGEEGDKGFFYWGSLLEVSCFDYLGFVFVRSEEGRV